MSKVHLVVGPVGAGKSTFAIGLSQRHGALRLTLDEWMATLFRPDRPQENLVTWYAERAHRCVAQILRVAQAALAMDVDSVLEIGLIRRAERLAFYERLEAAAVDYTVYLLDAPRDVRRQRVAERNASQGPTFSMVVPSEIFELASDMWEPPDDDECRGRDLRRVAPD